MGKLKLTKRALIRIFSHIFLRFHFSTWKIVQKAENSSTNMKNMFSISRTIIQTFLTASLFRRPFGPDIILGSIAAAKIIPVKASIHDATCCTPSRNTLIAITSGNENIFTAPLKTLMTPSCTASTTRWGTESTAKTSVGLKTNNINKKNGIRNICSTG